MRQRRARAIPLPLLGVSFIRGPAATSTLGPEPSTPPPGRGAASQSTPVPEGQLDTDRAIVSASPGPFPE